MSPEQFELVVIELIPLIMELGFISGFFGAICVWFLFELFGGLFEFLESRRFKARARAWKKRQDLAKAQANLSEETTPRGEPARHGAAALREVG